MNISIVGTGLLGGSFALALKHAKISTHIFGIDKNAENLTKALNLQIVDEASTVKQALPQSDLVILAIPVTTLCDNLHYFLDYINDHTIVFDLGSTKRHICEVANKHPKRKQFVAAHPIAGTEYSGPEAASTCLLLGKTMIICDPKNSGKKAIATVEKVSRQVGMHISKMDSKEHDLHLAYVSHLSHVTSFILGVTVLDKEKDEKAIFDMAGSGFSSTVRLAKSSPEMWGAIFEQNKDNLLEGINAYIDRISYFRDKLQENDMKSLGKIMNHANEIGQVLKGIK